MSHSWYAARHMEPRSLWPEDRYPREPARCFEAYRLWACLDADEDGQWNHDFADLADRYKVTVRTIQRWAVEWQWRERLEASDAVKARVNLEVAPGILLETYGDAVNDLSLAIASASRSLGKRDWEEASVADCVALLRVGVPLFDRLARAEAVLAELRDAEHRARVDAQPLAKTDRSAAEAVQLAHEGKPLSKYGEEALDRARAAFADLSDPAKPQEASA